MYDNINMFVMKVIIYMSKLEGGKILYFDQEEKQWKMFSV
jgi:hypothetical protein